MWPLPSLLLFTFLLYSTHFPALLGLPAQPDPGPLQPLVFPTSTPPSTIPAFPEQSDVAGSCPLTLPQELFHGISRACPASSSAPLSRSRCCPPLAAWLYTAYSATALAAAARLPPPSTTSARPSSDMPVLPDDSEACVDGVEKALRARGVALAAVNDTCDVAYCYCGVRLRPFTCPGALALERDAAGRWLSSGDASRRIERDCATPGVAGCSRCLRSLYQVRSRRRRPLPPPGLAAVYCTAGAVFLYVGTSSRFTVFGCYDGLGLSRSSSTKAAGRRVPAVQ